MAVTSHSCIRKTKPVIHKCEYSTSRRCLKSEGRVFTTLLLFSEVDMYNMSQGRLPNWNAAVIPDELYGQDLEERLFTSLPAGDQ